LLGIYVAPQKPKAIIMSLELWGDEDANGTGFPFTAPVAQQQSAFQSRASPSHPLVSLETWIRGPGKTYTRIQVSIDGIMPKSKRCWALRSTVSLYCLYLDDNKQLINVFRFQDPLPPLVALSL
jgi:hypothetical protein